MEYYTSSTQHILAELERIDLLIQMQVYRARLLQEEDEQFLGLYIAEKEVDGLLAEPAGLPRWATLRTHSGPAEITGALDQVTAKIARDKAISVEQGVTLRLDELARHMHLTSIDLDALLICLAPEIDLRYERLYAYLQDDITKKRPSVDLVLNLLSPSLETKLTARRRFASSAPLLDKHLLQLFDDPSQQQPPLLSKYLKVEERVVGYLLGTDEFEARLRPYLTIRTAERDLNELHLPSDVKHRLALLAHKQAQQALSLILYFQGPYGVGKETTAAAISRDQGSKLLVVDGEKLLNPDGLAFEMALRLVMREAIMQDALLYWSGFDALLADDRKASRDTFLNMLAQRSGLTILAGATTWEPNEAHRHLPFVRIEFTRPTYNERIQLWTQTLPGPALQAADVDPVTLANKFRLSGGQIQDAAITARNLARWRDPENEQLTMADLYSACRLHSNRSLSTLAQKLTPQYTWQDIVLPADRTAQLREICNHVKYRALVFDTWGFDRKLSLGKGLNVLFAGPSGTGKTMAAEIMAGELGLDLYKIDLSTVVSKYIGETEKNLARIFAEAETSNAILFFDEADALFGKRSEVRDSHDRYANLEISYLLQRMEEYSGMTILATNLQKNMDEAFVRRMQFTIEFPFPDSKHRRRIWEKIWPFETPRCADLDLDLMAQRFELAGGNIRNIALTAAFLAADDSALVNMNHLLQATQREYQKMGKVVINGEFGEYAKR